MTSKREQELRAEAKGREFFESPGIRHAYFMIEMYLNEVGVLAFREKALKESFEELLKFYDGASELPDAAVGQVVQSLTDALSLFADLGAVISASAAPLKLFADRWFKVTTSKTTRAFRRLLSANPVELASALLGFPPAAILAKDPGIPGPDLAVLETLRELGASSMMPSLRMIARLYLHNEPLLHAMKHCPASVAWRLVNSEDVPEQSLAVHLRPDVWTQEGANPPPEGVLMVWLSETMLKHVWGQAIEEAHGYVQVALTNRQAKLRFADENLLPTFWPLPTPEARAEFVRSRDASLEPRSIANVTLEVSSSAPIQEGGWLKGEGTTWERLRAERWPYDDKLRA